MRTHRSRGRLLRYPQALSQRGFLHQTHLSIDGLPDDHVPGTVCNSAHVGMDLTEARNAAISRAEDLPAPSNLFGLRSARLRHPRPPRLRIRSGPGAAIWFWPGPGECRLAIWRMTATGRISWQN